MLWSKGFGDVFSVNPPSYAYGNVYVQTGNHGSDTWLRAFDGETGAVVFKAPHSAQWERYLAPTIFDGKAYINGGYYGGMYGFDAFTGDQLWFADLPQYDGWTPAVDEGHAYAYLAGLHALNRQTGATDYIIQDPNWYYDSYEAPVLGDHDDVIVIQDGKLISFDTVTHSIRWSIPGEFDGQPSLAQGRIYAIDGGRLRVIDELTHAELWSWQAPEGNLTGAMIVTDSHVFVSSASRVHAVSRTTHQSVWSYAVAGHLAIADATLYVASSDGWLTALSGPSATSFYTLPPCRVMDTRGAAGVPLGGPALTSGMSRSVHIPGLCGVPATAKAVAVNVTVTAAQSNGYLRLSTSDTSTLTSTLNYSAGLTRSNNSFVTLDLSGNFDALVMQSTGTTAHVIIDVSGYFE
jgi:outer membrane protein assembly factor BamB